MAEEDVVLATACRNNDGQTVTSSLTSSKIKSYINNKIAANKVPGLDTDIEFTTALNLACECSTVDIVQRLLHHGADVKVRDGWDSTPLHCACVSDIDRIEKVTLLLSVDKSALHAQNKYKHLPIHYAALNDGHDVIGTLVQHGADVNAKGQYGRTAVHHAAQEGCVKVIEELVKYNADINVKDENGQLPLHIASLSGRLECVSLFIDTYHCDVNSKNNYGNTPLHRAAQYGHLNIVQYLVSNPTCDITITNDAGQTAADVAREEKQHHVEMFMANLQLTKPLHDEISRLKKTQEATLQALGGLAVTDDQKQSAQTIADAVRFHMKKLVDDIHAADHLDFLYSRRALTADEYEKISHIVGATEQCRKLLITLTAKKSPSWAPIFLESLENEPTTRHAAVLIRSTDMSDLPKEDIR